MTTPLNAMHRTLNAMDEELGKGPEANLSTISEHSDIFHRIISRNNWAGSRLEIKNQFMARWFDLDEQAKALASQPAQQHSAKPCKEEQLSLAI